MYVSELTNTTAAHNVFVLLAVTYTHDSAAGDITEDPGTHSSMPPLSPPDTAGDTHTKVHVGEADSGGAGGDCPIDILHPTDNNQTRPET